MAGALAAGRGAPKLAPPSGADGARGLDVAGGIAVEDPGALAGVVVVPPKVKMLDADEVPGVLLAAVDAVAAEAGFAPKANVGALGGWLAAGVDAAAGTAPNPNPPVGAG